MIRLFDIASGVAFNVRMSLAAVVATVWTGYKHNPTFWGPERVR